MSGKTIKYLGIDWGEKRIGLALGDSETKIATPYKVVSSIDEVIKAVKDEDINVVVVGKPFQISDFRFQISDEFNGFLNLLKNKVNIPVKTVDERLSSKAADALGGDKKTKAARDAVAAMLILQTYLDKTYNPNAPN
jgi:putative Holliday junction resolvase